MSAPSCPARPKVQTSLWKYDIMGKVRTSAFSVSIDGFGAALNQNLDNPFGQGGMALPGWMLKTRMFHAMRGQEGGSTGVDERKASKWFPIRWPLLGAAMVPVTMSRFPGRVA